MGFFLKSETIHKAPASSVPACGACGLYKTCKTPKMRMEGKGRRGILVVGGSPSEEEDDRGVPFRGEEGTYLQKVLRRYGISLWEDCWLTNALICRPKKHPTPDQVDWCRPNVINAISRLGNSLVSIVLMGTEAVRSVIGHFWKEDPGSINRWAGFTIPSRNPNVWIHPIWHPGSVLPELDRKDSAASLLFDRQVEKAFSKKKKPWDVTPPDLKGQVDILYDADTIVEVINQYKGMPAAFDYETNCKKPEIDSSQIVCASICFWDRERGELKTIAFPWKSTKVRKAFKAFLESDSPKIASNMKFEDRWSTRLATPPKNWVWDTMVAAHVLDNRPDICGLKFQAYACLGIEKYDNAVESSLGSKKGKDLNRILDEVDMDSLLLYCGMDSLLEYQLAVHQMKKMKHPSLEIVT